MIKIVRKAETLINSNTRIDGIDAYQEIGSFHFVTKGLLVSWVNCNLPTSTVWLEEKKWNLIPLGIKFSYTLFG